MPAYLLPFAISSTASRGAPRPVLAVCLLACLAHDAFVYREVRSIDQDLLEYANVLNRIPAGKTVLPLICEPARLGVPVYRHFAHWRVINGLGRVPGTFASPETSFYEHFWLKPPYLYRPDVQ
jgi:hypothetical protein